MNDLVEAERDFREAEERGNRSGLANDLGLVLERLGRGDEAAKEYRLAISSYSDSLPPLNLGDLELKRGNLADSERLLRKAVAMAPDLGKRLEPPGPHARRHGSGG